MLKILLKHIDWDIIFNKDGDELLASREILKDEWKIALSWRTWRWMVVISSPFELLIFSDQKSHINQQRKYFEEDMAIYISMLRNICNTYTKHQNTIDNKFKRFTHNIRSSNARNIQLLEQCIEMPISDKRFRETLLTMLDTDQGKKKIYKALLSFKKDSDDIKNEIKAFKLLDAQDPHEELSPKEMPIHWVILGIINVFYFEFLDKNIHFEIWETHNQILLDYPSISVIVHHILENALKYCKDWSTIQVIFQEYTNSFAVEFHMTSLEVLASEITKIFSDSYSWINATKIWINWNWIWMYIANEIAKINWILLEFNPWEFDSCHSIDKSVRYCFNVVKISFPFR